VRRCFFVPKHYMTKTKRFILGSALAVLTLCGSAFGFQTTKSTAATKASAAAAPSAGDVALAKTRGDVWVNLNTNKYHVSADPKYGTTKKGKFMSEAEAIRGGYVAAKGQGMKTKAAVAKRTTAK